MKRIKSYISDSYVFSQILETTIFPQNCWFLTADVINLYPSIVISDGLTQLKRALRLCNFLEDMIMYILDLTNWVLTNNYFLFGDSIWFQKKGTAMGTSLAVVFANIYLAMLETDCFEICRADPNFKMPLLYNRFVDDKTSIFVDKRSGEIFITNFNKMRPNSIKDTYSLSDTNAIFLDIEYFKGPRFLATGLLDTKIYQKTMNNYLYIPPFSAHSKINMTSVIVSMLQRYRMFCNNSDDYISLKQLYYDRLLARGYTRENLLTIFSTNLDRDTLREKRNIKNKSNLDKILPPIFKIINTPRIQNMNITSLLKYTDQVHMDKDSHLFIPQKEPFMSLKRPRNLADYLVTSKFNSLVTPSIIRNSDQ